MSDHTQQLEALPKEHDFFVGIDSDGCAFDAMEIKHKECFIPAMIKHWDLQPISRFARQASEFVNLYSRHRGSNRFVALLRVMELLGDWPQVQRRGYRPPDMTPLREWIERETRLSSITLREEVNRSGEPLLERALAWSDAANAAIEDMVRNVPPYPLVRESLRKLCGGADIIVCSSTPLEALQREWAEHGLAQYAAMICGQEQGSKKEHLRYAASGKYDPDKVLMIGDAPGDMRAAKSNGFLYYPINPGREAESWQRFHDEAAGRFFDGAYAGDYEAERIEEFKALLPSDPPWKRRTS
ncbi:MAG: HAD family hydrolase [Phycisphaerae bacterium]